MFKVLEFDAFHDDFGQVLFPIDTTRPLHKQASWEVKLAEEVAAFCESIDAHPDRRYFVNVALGASETWGMNKNGDWFPRCALAHDCEAAKIRKLAGADLKDGTRGFQGDYGHKTFLKAGRYKHHKNKDPRRSLGKVVYAHWNPRMDRVELVSYVDAKKAPDIAERLDAFEESGEKIATSMGCRVPFDVCSVCHHKAATVKQYCGHLKTAMGRILPGGRAVYAINENPFFFDDSFVIAPAAHEAGVTMKVASEAHAAVPSAVLGLEIYGEDKASSMKKEVPAEVALTVDERQEIDQAHALMADLVPAIEAAQAPLPKEAIASLASRPIDDVLASASALGIFFTPEEFQKLALYSRDMVGLADHFEAEGICFDPEDPRAYERLEDLPPAGDVDKVAVELLAPHMPERSFWEPHFSDRLDRYAEDPGLTRKFAERLCREKIAIDALEVMLPLALGYLMYRVGTGKNITELDRAIDKHPYLAAPVLGLSGHAISYMLGDDEPQRVTEKTGDSLSMLGRYVLPGGAPYLYSAELRKKERQGHRLGSFEQFVRSHPGTTALLGIGSAALLAPKLKGVRKALEGYGGRAKDVLSKLSELSPEKRAELKQTIAQARGLSQKSPGVLQTARDVVGSAGKHVLSGFYKARNFPGAIADEIALRALLGS